MAPLVLFFAILVFITGVLPILINFGIELPAFLSMWWVVPSIVLLLGIITIAGVWMDFMYTGGRKFLVGFYGFIVIVAGVLPFIAQFMDLGLPFDPSHSLTFGIIVLILGALGILEGMMMDAL